MNGAFVHRCRRAIEVRVSGLLIEDGEITKQRAKTRGTARQCDAGPRTKPGHGFREAPSLGVGAPRDLDEDHWHQLDAAGSHRAGSCLAEAAISAHRYRDQHDVARQLGISKAITNGSENFKGRRAARFPQRRCSRSGAEPDHPASPSLYGRPPRPCRAMPR